MTICICQLDGIRHPDYPCNDNSMADGYCEDENNIEMCEFDGGKMMLYFLTNPKNLLIKYYFIPNLGDCCLPMIISDYCVNCTCYETGMRHPDNPCFNTGDGYCDDENNIEICDFDGGKLQPAYVIILF